MTTTVVLGVLKAPVEERWSFSKSSCSSFGRRGGAGPEEKGGAVRRQELDERKRRADTERMVEDIDDRMTGSSASARREECDS